MRKCRGASGGWVRGEWRRGGRGGKEEKAEEESEEV